MNHSMNIVAMQFENFFNHRSISACRRQNELSVSQTCLRFNFGKRLGPRIDKLIRDRIIETFGIFSCKLLAEYIMTGRSQSIAPHPSVVLILVRSLSERG